MYVTYILVLVGLNGALVISLTTLTKSLMKRSNQLSEARFIISDLSVQNKILQEQINSLKEKK